MAGVVVLIAVPACELLFPPGPGGVVPPDADGGEYCPTDDSPVGYWRLGEATGPIAADASGNANDGIYAGDVTLGATGALGSTDTAVSFPRLTQGFVRLGDKFGFPGAAAFSVEAWIKPDSQSGYFRHIFTKEHRSSPKEGWALLIDEFGKAYLERYAADAGVLSPFGDIVAETYTHVVGTYDGALLHLYINGAEVDLGTPDPRPMPMTTDQAVIGAGATSGLDANFGGQLDEVAVYAVALSPAQVRKHFETAESGSCLDPGE